MSLKGTQNVVTFGYMSLHFNHNIIKHLLPHQANFLSLSKGLIGKSALSSSTPSPKLENNQTLWNTQHGTLKNLKKGKLLVLNMLGTHIKESKY